ncbi:hypothetical protein XENORESO_000289 [Xenotaenia resolanae]|uniref:Uncharacterized protein n=1 Tax=Xenotaenia resolanae TaxID=208358 RepID=A0ABV0VL40_9TELE
MQRYFAKTQIKFHWRTNLLCPSNQDFSKDLQAKFRLAATDPLQPSAAPREDLLILSGRSTLESITC